MDKQFSVLIYSPETNQSVEVSAKIQRIKIIWFQGSSNYGNAYLETEQNIIVKWLNCKMETILKPSLVKGMYIKKVPNRSQITNY